MADIKTRDTVKGTIKTLDKATVAGPEDETGIYRHKKKAEHPVNTNEAEEYAADEFKSGVIISHDVVYSW